MNICSLCDFIFVLVALVNVSLHGEHINFKAIGDLSVKKSVVRLV